MTEFNKPTDDRQVEIQKTLDGYYELGWNSALEMAAFKIEHGFQDAFGKDTLSSIAIYIRGMKK